MRGKTQSLPVIVLTLFLMTIATSLSASELVLTNTAAFGNMNHPNDGYSNITGLTGWYLGSHWRSWYKWDISSIPDDVTIDKVEISMYCDFIGASESQTIDVYDFTLASYGPYDAYDQTIYDALAAGTKYTSFNVTFTGWYPTETTYYDLGSQAATDLQGDLSGDWFQIGLSIGAGYSTYKRFGTSSTPASVGHKLRVTYSGGSIVELTDFTAAITPAGIACLWATGSEIDSIGFNLYRSDAAEGDYVKVNETLIPSKGGPTEGASYEYVDPDCVTASCYYKLEDMDADGTGKLHGPVLATPSTPFCGTSAAASGLNHSMWLLFPMAAILWRLSRRSSGHPSRS